MKAIIRGREQGAVAPLVAILMVVFILCIALVVDLGRLHNVKIQLQRAVDAAALSGALKLTGDTGQDDNAANTARATAATNEVDGITDGSWVDSTTITIELGSWDTDITASDRFSTPVDTDTANAIRVEANLEIDNIFFFLSDTSNVTADAIAISTFEEQTIPIVVVSCIPPGGQNFPGVLSPGDTVDDVALYTFGAAINDTAAWSSLTIENANSNNIDEFFSDCGTRLFNKIVYGTTESHDGIENESVKKGGCTTDDNLILVKDFNDLCNEPTNITCGLGDDYTGSSPLDPLSFDPLPRWDDFADIQRIWSQDNVLTPNTDNDENFRNKTVYPNSADDLEYQKYIQRLAALYDASDPDNPYTYVQYNIDYSYSPTTITDDRFTRFIDVSGGTKALFEKPMAESGYPSVWLIEGETNTIVDFLKTVVPTDGSGKLVGDDFKPILTNDNEPFDDVVHTPPSYGRGETVQLTIPVIFTGECTDTKYNKPGLYIGTANLLLTRMWRTINECYDVSDENALELQAGADFSRYGSDKNSFDLPALIDNKFLCTKGFAGKSFEGLIRPPGGDEETKAGILKVYLVE